MAKRRLRARSVAPAGKAVLGRETVPAGETAPTGKSDPAKKKEALERCQLCLRETPRITVHHLVPKAQGGRFGPKASLCSTCHRQLHATFSVATLAKELDSIQAIEANPEMARYLKWARRQKGHASFPVRRSARRR